MAFSLASPFPLLHLLLSLPLTTASPLSHSLSPNFTASYSETAYNYSAFLASGAFVAAITLGAFDTPYAAVILTANRDSPSTLSSAAILRLTATGLSLEDGDGKFVWSTPPFNSPVSLLQLHDNENIVLLNRFNWSLWESFDYPTDTLVIGQR